MQQTAFVAPDVRLVLGIQTNSETRRTPPQPPGISRQEIAVRIRYDWLSLVSFHLASVEGHQADHLKPWRPTDQCRSALVLLSGGIDSACCAHWYASAGYTVTGLFIDHGQHARIYEGRAAADLARALSIDLRMLSIEGLAPRVGNIKGRNAALLLLALMHSSFECGVVAIGVHAGTAYEDCSPVFVDEMQRVFDLYSYGRIRVGAPFLHWSKHEILSYARSASIPLDKTRSCERETSQPCGQCLSCRDLEALRAY